MADRRPLLDEGLPLGSPQQPNQILFLLHVDTPSGLHPLFETVFRKNIVCICTFRFKLHFTVTQVEERSLLLNFKLELIPDTENNFLYRINYQTLREIQHNTLLQID